MIESKDRNGFVRMGKSAALLRYLRTRSSLKMIRKPAYQRLILLQSRIKSSIPSQILTRWAHHQIYLPLTFINKIYRYLFFQMTCS